ncbi:YkvA family protein [Calothrix sp. 336/3]|uniref:YkvA family protein n=1 Tax=Calothrix sp. 336/3 TaxID=1337936 RepID=UPI0004E28FF7|nr:YkvA family protein [Calothrix sp. 336/3]AKG21853.1 hypothetical protein IJ00_11805 [Calothrix sp. 336/3]
MRKKFITQVLQDWLKKVLRHPQYRWLAIVTALLYLVSPLDILPDAIPLLGWIDDGVIASLVIAEVSQIFMDKMKNRQKNPVAEADFHQSTDTVIDVDAVSVR